MGGAAECEWDAEVRAWNEYLVILEFILHPRSRGFYRACADLCRPKTDTIRAKWKEEITEDGRTLQQPSACTQSYYQYSFVPHTNSIWNTPPYEVTSASSCTVFKRLLQSHI